MSDKRNQPARRIAPGFWIDAAGDLHISIPELLEQFGISDTPQNRERCARIATQAISQFNSNGVIIRRTAHCPVCDSINCRLVEANETVKGEFCCRECGTFFCEPIQ